VTPTNLERFCANGDCGASLEGMRSGALYCSATCRTAGWKAREGITGYRAVKASQNGKTKASGLQISYRKALEVLGEHFISRGETYPSVLARNILKSALSDRQRATLERREPRA
jgi:hypothetical protein